MTAALLNQPTIMSIIKSKLTMDTIPPAVPPAATMPSTPPSPVQDTSPAEQSNDESTLKTTNEDTNMKEMMEQDSELLSPGNFSDMFDTPFKQQ